MNRRQFAVLLTGAAVSLLAGAPRAAWAAEPPKLNDDGLYEEPFFIQSFLILKEDLEAATANGKRLAVMWELKGCPYCRETHLVNFADPEIRSFVEQNFEILQLNIIGSREVTDFDGEVLSEKKLARKWGVRFTPTLQFFPDHISAAPVPAGNKLEVVRMPGYFRPPHFLAMFRFVNEKAYRQTDFRSYLKTLTPG